MAKFFILGDSWGLGEWQIKNKTMECVPDTGIDYYLSKLGHSTTNVSAGSAGNFGQLRHAYWTLKEKADYDYIIWFHTEPFRDIVDIIIDDPTEGLIQYPNFKNITDYFEASAYVNECNYKYAQETIYKEFNIPFIVIGGVGRLENCIDNYSFARHKIYSWTEELLNIDYKLLRNLLLRQRWEEVFSTFKYDKQQILTEIEATSEYQNLLWKSPLFPDNGHVVRFEYKKLAHRLLKCYNIQ